MNMNDMHKNFDTQKIINEFPALKQKVWYKIIKRFCIFIHHLKIFLTFSKDNTNLSKSSYVE